MTDYHLETFKTADNKRITVIKQNKEQVLFIFSDVQTYPHKFKTNGVNLELTDNKNFRKQITKLYNDINDNLEGGVINPLKHTENDRYFLNCVYNGKTFVHDDKSTSEFNKKCLCDLVISPSSITHYEGNNYIRFTIKEVLFKEIDIVTLLG